MQGLVFKNLTIVALFSLCAGAGGLACYDPPPIPPSQPVACNAALASDKACPVGYACVAGVCVTKTCRNDSDCPSGFVCGRGGCALPSEAGVRSSGAGALGDAGSVQSDGGVKP